MKILIIQTAFIGDVILATALIEKLSENYPDSEIHFLVRKGNEGLLKDHPLLEKVWIFNKSEGKYQNLFRLVSQIRSEKFNIVINVQRFFTTGLITALSGGKKKIGFDKNPLSFLFNEKVKHTIGDGRHEVDRNHSLIAGLTNEQSSKPKLYPSAQDYQSVKQYQDDNYICIAPTSVWYTKQFPAEQWIDFINQVPSGFMIYLLGAPVDIDPCEHIKQLSTNSNVMNLAGKLNLLASAALMKSASMNYVNDSAPMHLASAMNAPVCAVFCSTVPAFGFGPLSDKSYVIETEMKLYCRPCGLHGHKACPQTHYNCAKSIEVKRLLDVLEKVH